MDIDANALPIGPITAGYIVRAFGEEYLELCCRPLAERMAMLEERWQQGGTIDDTINTIGPSEFFPTLAAAKRFHAAINPSHVEARE